MRSARDLALGLPTLLAHGVRRGERCLGPWAGGTRKDRAQRGTSCGNSAEGEGRGGSVNSKRGSRAEGPEEDPQEPGASYRQGSLVCDSRDPVLGEPAFRPQQVSDKWSPQHQVQLPVASVQCGWRPGDRGPDEVPLHQGWEWPAWFLGLRSCQWSLKPGPGVGMVPSGPPGCRKRPGPSHRPRLLVCERWELEAQPAVRGGHGRQRPMYNSSQKKTVARPQGLPLPLRTPDRDSPHPRRKGLQRPLELVPRQVLPDGGLGAGGIPQFSPDHLRAEGRHEWGVHQPHPLAHAHTRPRCSSDSSASPEPQARRRN